MGKMDRSKLPIAFFDSGIGGLTVLKTAIAKLPEEHYIYYADTKNVPYGTKPREEIIRFIFDAVEFLASHRIKILVVACNTATSAAINELRATYDFPIIGMEPAVKPAILNNKSKKVLVLATSFTLRERKLESLISDLGADKIVDKLSLDKLVTYAENFDFDSPVIRAYIESRFDGIKLDDYETAVLGCTHFLFYKKLLSDILGPGIELIDGNEGTVNQMIRVMASNGLVNPYPSAEISFYSSGISDDPERVGKLTELLSSKHF
jgi:glutamate racemase